MKTTEWIKQTELTGLHVGIIPDGMRRWAKENNTELLDTYLFACRKLETTINFFLENQVEIISVFLLSADNLKRDSFEVKCVVDSLCFFLMRYYQIY